jgi:hypothetical protein
MKNFNLILLLFLLTKAMYCHINNSIFNNETESGSDNNSTLISNTVGKLLDIDEDDLILKEFPFVLTRCDQIIHYNGEIIPDHTDYTKRKDVFITINAYHINIFDEEDPNTLRRSVLLPNSQISFINLRGGRGCLKIFNKMFNKMTVKIKKKPILVCFGSMGRAGNLLKVFDFYNKCNTGKMEKMIDKKSTSHVNIFNNLKNIISEENCAKKNPKTTIAKIKKLQENVMINRIVNEVTKKG